MRLFISNGNKKLGPIPNVSLPPIKTCIENPQCAEKCYARKFSTGYAKNTAGIRWEENWQLWQENPARFELELSNYLTWAEPRYFRWHVGGDIPDENYLRMMKNIAWLFPQTKFMAYSKRPWAWTTEGNELKNLSIIRSLWINEPVADEEPYMFYKVWPKDKEPSSHEIWCSGDCTSCKACWRIKLHERVNIHIH